MTLDLTLDELLTTTRAVRKRLDLTRPVERKIVEECIEIAIQAPSGSNQQRWHFVVATDPELKEELGKLYRKGQRNTFGRVPAVKMQSWRIRSSGQSLASGIPLCTW